MQFSSILVAATAFALAKAAQITNTPGDFVGVSTGKAFDITWANATGAVTLLLKNGPSTNLQTVSTIATGLSGATGSYSWTPASSLVSGMYAFEIDDSTGPNYSIEFAVSGASSSSSSASSTSSGSSSSSSTSASTTSSTSSTSTGSSSSSSQTGSTTSSTSSGSSSSSASKTSSASTTSKTGSTTTTAASTSPTTSSISSASNLSSPLALVLLAIAAFVTLN